VYKDFSALDQCLIYKRRSTREEAHYILTRCIRNIDDMVFKVIAILVLKTGVDYKPEFRVDDMAFSWMTDDQDMRDFFIQKRLKNS
jgi:hypothetical protein